MGLKEKQVSQVLELTGIPFIIDYRKKWRNLDEVEIKAIIDLDKSMTGRA